MPDKGKRRTIHAQISTSGRLVQSGLVRCIVPQIQVSRKSRTVVHRLYKVSQTLDAALEAPVELLDFEMELVLPRARCKLLLACRFIIGCPPSLEDVYLLLLLCSLLSTALAVACHLGVQKLANGLVLLSCPPLVFSIPETDNASNMEMKRLCLDGCVCLLR